MLAQRLRTLREQRGFTQYSLAKASGLTASYIYKLEDGKARRPSYDTLQKLADALEIPVSDLADEVSDSVGVAASGDPDATEQRHTRLVQGMKLKDPIEFLREFSRLSVSDQEFIADMVRNLLRRGSSRVLPTESVDTSAKG
jgi:transcriptional regulator with XRE-family HTH domain